MIQSARDQGPETWLFDIGDYTTQLYGDDFMSQYKDPVTNQSVYWHVSQGFVLNAAQLFFWGAHLV